MTDPIEEIRRLQELHSQGMLTDDEFARAKAQLLNQIGQAAPPSAVGGAPVYGQGPAAQGQRRPPRDIAVWMHLSSMAGVILPFAGFVAPIVLWQMNKDVPLLDAHGKIVANWIVSSLIYAVVSLILTCVVIGIIPLIAVGILNFVFPIMAAVKASRDEIWPYPLSIQFFK